MKISIKINDIEITATMENSSITQEFVSLLPLELKLDDYAGTEKISYLPRKLSKEGTSPGYNPSIGDITYYAPWGNLAIFYKDFGYANGLIKLGSIDGDGVNILNNNGSFNVIIDLIPDN